jgi:hypothetical protein
VKVASTNYLVAMWACLIIAALTPSWPVRAIHYGLAALNGWLAVRKAAA